MKQDPAALQAAIDGFDGAEHDCAKHGLLTSTNHAAFCVGSCSLGAR